MQIMPAMRSSSILFQKYKTLKNNKCKHFKQKNFGIPLFTLRRIEFKSTFMNIFDFFVNYETVASEGTYVGNGYLTDLLNKIKELSTTILKLPS